MRVSNQRSRRDRPRLRGEEYAALDLGHLNRLGNRRDRQARHARQGPGGIIVTMLLGIAGSIVATWLGRVVGLYQEGQ